MTSPAEKSPAALIDRFARNPAAAGKAMREALDRDPGSFAETILRDAGRDAGDRGFRYALILLRNGGLLIPAIANPAATSFGQALRITRAMLGIEKNFANEILDAALDLHELRKPECSLRILKITAACAGQVTNWRAVTRLHAHGDSRVRSKCASLLARFHFFHFYEYGVLARFEQGESRERANLVEALWETPPSKSQALVEQALADSDNRVAGNACLALYRAGDCRALTRLAEMIRCGQRGFRATAAWAMGRLRDARFAALLREAAESGIPSLRRTAIRSLVNLDRIESCEVAGDMQAVFVSAPMAVESSELWIRVLRPDGAFVNGLEPIDFFVFGPRSAILNYSVERCGGTDAPSIRIAWPVAHDPCHQAIVRSFQSRPASQTWALDGYGGTCTGTQAGPDERYSMSKSMEASCWNLLTRETAGSNHHLAVFFEDDPPGLNWSALRDACYSRDIRLHCWRIGAPGETDVDRLWSGFIASLGSRYVVRTRLAEPVRNLAIRKAGRTPVRFSACLDVGARVKTTGAIAQ